MKIGIIGIRGIPNRYGGFEQFVEYIAPALVKKGHEVIVYTSSLHPYKETEWKGVRLVQKFDPEDKLGTAGQFIYDFFCILDSRKQHFDIILQLGYTSSSIWSFLFPRKPCLITNMDGLEWKRSKYSQPIQRFLTHAEKWAALHSDKLIADSKGIQEYLLEKYHKSSDFIPYGAELFQNPDENSLSLYGLKKHKFNLLIARMEPENNVETIIRGYIESGCSDPLIIIGNNTNKFGKYITYQYKAENICFWGPIYDINILNQLRYFSNLYFHGHSVGGTNPSLLEAMASQCLIVAHDNIFNRSVLEEDALYFNTASDIASILKKNISKPLFWSFVLKNNTKISSMYSWDIIINRFETYLCKVIHEHR